MVLSVCDFQLGESAVRIDSGRRHVRVAKQDLDYFEVGAVVNEMGGTAVAQPVGAGRSTPCPYDLKDSLTTNPSTPLRDKERRSFLLRALAFACGRFDAFSRFLAF
jgi:hypothetical protein